MAIEQSGAEEPPGEPASQAAPGDAAGPGAQAAPPAIDDVKRKFREALDRKRGAHATAQGADHAGKVQGAHGPAASRRSFRRKSG